MVWGMPPTALAGAESTHFARAEQFTRTGCVGVARGDALLLLRWFRYAMKSVLQPVVFDFPVSVNYLWFLTADPDNPTQRGELALTSPSISMIHRRDRTWGIFHLSC